MKREILDRLLTDRAANRSLALVTRLATGEQWLVYPQQHSGGELGAATLAGTRRMLAEDRSGIIDSDSPDGRLFVQVFNPALRLVVVGAVHIAQALVPLARLSGYQAIVIDPRQAWTSDVRFPGINISREWPDDALRRLAPDHRTAVVTLSHDPKLDDPALRVALRSPAFYIGSLGSKKTHAARLERLGEAGFSDAELGRIHGPIGLNLGARSPAEIAIAIMAQIIQVLHKVAL